MPLDLKITIPTPDDKAFEKGFDDIFRVLDKAEAQLKRIDKLMRRTGQGIKAGEAGGKGSGGKGGRKGARRGGILGGGNTGNIALLARAGGIGGPAAAGLGAGLGVGAVVALTVALRNALRASAEFETQLAEIGRVSGITGDRLTNFGDQITRLSTNLPVTTQRLFQLASAGANAGLAAEDLSSFVDAMARLATILPQLSEEQVRGILRIADLTDFPIERIDELNGALVKLQQSSKATLPQLLALSQRVAQDAGIFGATTEEVTALAASIADLGLQPERASTAIGRIVGQLAQLDAFSDDVVKKVTDTFRTQTSVSEFRQLLAQEGPVALLIKIGEESVNARKALEALSITGKQNVIGQNLLQNIDTYTRLLKAADPNSLLIDEQVSKRLDEFTVQSQLAANKIANAWKLAGDSFKDNVAIPLLALFNDLTKVDASVAAIANTIFDNLVKQTQDTRREILARGAIIQSSDLAQIDPRFIADQIKAIDKELNDLREKFQANPVIKLIDVDRVREQLRELRSLSADTRFDAQLAKAQATANRLASALGRSVSELEKIQNLNKNLEFELRISDFSDAEQQIERIVRAASSQFADLLGDQILRPEQIDKFRQTISDIAAGLDFDLRVVGGPQELVDRLEEFNKASADLTAGQRRAVQEAIVAAERINTSELLIAELNRKRNLELDQILKKQLVNIEKERQNILKKRAPAIRAIQDAGTAVELFNQRQADAAIQEEELEVLEEIRDIARERFAFERRNKTQVVTRPTRG